MVNHQHVPYEVEDDGGMLFEVEVTASGSLTALVRVYGRVVIDGKLYEYDKNVRVKLNKSTTEQP